MAETLSCGDYDLYIAQRGGQKLVTRLTGASSIRYNRTLNDFSEANVEVGYSGCVSSLTSVNPWQHELLIFRDRKLVWCGPLMNIKYVPSRDQIKIHARDLLAWTEKRFIEIEEDYDVEEVDIKEVFGWVLYHGYTKDPWNMVWYLEDTGLPISRFYPGKYGDRWGGLYPKVADELRTLSQSGIDYTVINRTMYAGDLEVRPPSKSTLHLSDKSWVEVPEITISGTQMSTRTAVAGGNGGYYGWYSDQMWIEETADLPWGLLETFTNRADVDADTTELPNVITQEAHARHEFLRQPLAYIEGGQLATVSSFDFNDMIPGVRMKVGLLEAIRDIETDYRLANVDISVNNDTEKIDMQLTLPGVATLLTD